MLKVYKLIGKKTDIIREINDELDIGKNVIENKITYDKEGNVLKSKTTDYNSAYIKGKTLYEYERLLFRKGYKEVQ